MKISYNWLKDYLDFQLTPDKLSELLTNCGLEVEGMESWQSVKGGLEGLVIGEVKSCTKHPGGDRLSLTTVDIGNDKILPIVCGAPNVAEGQKVVVATVGTTLHKGEETFEIKKAKIRGEISEGMICAEDEIGLGTGHEGILVLDPDVQTGIQASEYFNITEDVVFEIGLTPNRTDAMSHIGVARDIRAVLENLPGEKQKSYTLKVPSIDAFSPDNHDLEIPVSVESPEACPRYTGVTISGIEVKESPEWLKNRLNAIGLRPINNIVDITNYVLHETGQPLHAFDADEIKGNRIVVKKMAPGTKFITLDEITRELTSDDLMICNTAEGMCIGGVFGGIHSGVTEKTKAIFLESAYFDPVHIRKTSKYHDLQTDASFRFERGVDPEMTLFALKRATLMIKEIAGGTISSEIKDVLSSDFKRHQVRMLWKHIDRLIGKHIPRDSIKKILLSLEFAILEEPDDGLVLEVPAYRVDVTREADVIEEILRIYGYNNVEIPAHLTASLSFTAGPDKEKIINSLSDYLCSRGFSEIKNNSLTNTSYFDKGSGFDPVQTVPILNPLSRELGAMRQSLLFSGLETIRYNQNRKMKDLQIFEFGQVYSRVPGIPDHAQVTEKYNESLHLGIFITGRSHPESWFTGDEPSDFFELKSICQNILERTGSDQSNLSEISEVSSYFKQGLKYTDGQQWLLQMGVLKESITKDFEIEQPVYFAEIQMEKLIKESGAKKIKYEEIPKYPEVRRDLALLLDRSVPFSKVEEIAFKTELKLLRRINLFDVYEGKNIEKGKKSYAVSFYLQDPSGTLTDKVIDGVMNKLIKAYQQKLQATIR